MAPHQIQQGDFLLYENGIDTGFCITAEIYIVVLVEGDRVAFIATNTTEEQYMAALQLNRTTTHQNGMTTTNRTTSQLNVMSLITIKYFQKIRYMTKIISTVSVSSASTKRGYT